MRRILLIFSIALVAGTAVGQRITVQSVKQLAGTEKGGFYHPVFSPQGDYLLTTSEDYVGLTRHNLQSGSMQQLTADAGAGYGVNISADGNSIVYRRTDYKNNMRYTSLQQLNTQQLTTTQLVAPTRENVVAAYAKNEPVVAGGRRIIRKAQAQAAPFVAIENQKMVLYKDGQATVLTPNGENESYFWASVSPDGKHLLYYTAHGGTHVCDIDGSNARFIGIFNAPKWVDNNFIVGMVEDYDQNEAAVTRSVLRSYCLSTREAQLLTLPTVVKAMYPAPSADGKQIAFNTPDGRIYIMNIEISK